MLGHVDPAQVRIVAVAPVVYSGHDNITLARFTQVIDADGREATLDLSDITRLMLTFPEAATSTTFDSDDVPDVFDWSQGGGLIQFDLSSFDIPEGLYRAELVVYDAEHPRGQVLVSLDAPKGGLRLRIDQVNGGGGLPVPEWPDLANTVRNVVLTGLSLASAAVISASDSVMGAIGKLQAQITARALKGANSDITSLSGLTTPLSVEQGGTGQAEPLATVALTGQFSDLLNPPSTDAVAEGSTRLYFTATRVLLTVLTGLSLATASPISSADSVLGAFGKLQAQITALAAAVSNVDNTADVDKPVSLAQQAALDLKLDVGGSTEDLVEGEFNLFMTPAERIKLDNIDPYDYSIRTWAYAQSFRLVSATRDANEAIITATIMWPDGVLGIFTTDVASTAFPGAIDAWHATYDSTPFRTVTQPAVTRDANGAVIAQPLITIT